MQEPLDHQPDWFKKDDEGNTMPIEVPTENQFILLSVLTIGLYPIWWMYKCWLYFQEKEQVRLYPVFRAIFSIVFLFGLFNRIKSLAQQNGEEVNFSPLFLFLGYIAIALTGYLPEPYFLFAFFGYLLLLPPYRTFYQALRAGKTFTVQWQNNFNQRQQALVLFGGFLWLIMIIGLFGP